MRLLGLLVCVLTSLLGVCPSVHAVEVVVVPSECTLLTGSRKSVDVRIDPGELGVPLGSYGGSLVWNPTTLRLVDWSGGDPPFDDPVVGSHSAELGWITFADADPYGTRDSLRVLTVTFEALGEPSSTSLLEIDVSSLFSAETFENLMSQLQIADGAACVTDHDYELRLSGAANTLLDWAPIAGVQGYDVIRGDLQGLSTTSLVIDLGTVLCLENDSQDTTTGAGTEPINPDTEVPPEGSGYFYLVRGDEGSSAPTYGYYADCVRQRFAIAGDCVLSGR